MFEEKRKWVKIIFICWEESNIKMKKMWIIVSLSILDDTLWISAPASKVNLRFCWDCLYYINYANTYDYSCYLSNNTRIWNKLGTSRPKVAYLAIKVIMCYGLFGEDLCNFLSLCRYGNFCGIILPMCIVLTYVITWCQLLQFLSL